MADTPRLAILELETSQDGVTTFNAAARLLEQGWAEIRVIDRDLTGPPSHVDGNLYIPAATATGDWVGLEDDLVFSQNAAWVAVTPTEGMTAYVDDENIYIRWDGSAWLDWFGIGVIENGITASTTQSQGQQPLTATLNVIDTVANANDVVTMPTAVGGRCVYVVNDAASNVLQIFPASGDSIDGGSVDASITLAAGSRRHFIAQDATDWIRI